MTWKQTGGALPARVFGPVTSEMLVKYSGASGDFNPIHYDKDYAVAAGYRGVFAQGMFQAALLSTFVADLFGSGAVRRFAVKFRDQVWLGAILTCAGEVTEVTPGEDGVRVAVRLSLTSDEGAVVVVGDAELEVPARVWDAPPVADQALMSQGVGS
ncbi:MaoC/PaaZ C-terminal domain-containing protein [Streptomyces sp. NPDC090075]|uniref:MaoC/PaaZ C-terminal domain-containing protein n=1 Tax=Streptomyces sp. NPDC090075 TaxID=3365937 RepID=UPI003813A3FB